MTIYIIQRLLQIPIVLFVVASVLFFFVHAAGGPLKYLPLETEQSERVRLAQELGLNDPLPVQYLRSMTNLLRGEVGRSFHFHTPAFPLAMRHLPASIQLAATSFTLATTLAVVGGSLSGWNDGHILSRSAVRFSYLMEAVPTFWLAVLLIYFVAVKLRWLPTSGHGHPKHMILPMVSLAFVMFPRTFILARAAIRAVMNQGYVMTARAKGNTEQRILWRHAFRNTVVTIAPYLGIQPANLISGAVVVESIFAWRGLGLLAMEGVLHLDMPLIHATMLIMAFFVLASSFIVDVLIAFADPRIRVQ